MKEKILDILEEIYGTRGRLEDESASRIIELINKKELIAPSIDKRMAFAEDLAKKIDGDMPVSAILAATYWMQAEMINLNK